MSANADLLRISAVFLSAGADPDKLAAWLRVNATELQFAESSVSQ